MHKELRYEGEGSIRLDKFIAQAEPDVSRVQFQQLIAEGGVCVNGEVQQHAQACSRKHHSCTFGKARSCCIVAAADGVDENVIASLPLGWWYIRELATRRTPW